MSLYRGHCGSASICHRDIISHNKNDDVHSAMLRSNLFWSEHRKITISPSRVMCLVTTAKRNSSQTRSTRVFVRQPANHECIDLPCVLLLQLQLDSLVSCISHSTVADIRSVRQCCRQRGTVENVGVQLSCSRTMSSMTYVLLNT